MARIQQSVDISVPARVAYNQLTQFEDYPRFMQEVESAQQVDDTHVRWTTRIGQQKRDWNSEIIEQQPDQCIAWRNLEGPVNTGRVDVEALGEQAARVTFTLEADGAHSGTEGDHAMAKQVQEDLQRLKQMMEAQGHESGAWRGEVHGGQLTSGATAGQVGSRNLPHQSTEGYGDMGTNEAMRNALQGDGTPAADKEKLDASIKRAVPPSN
jgi:hypothetical protein